MKLVTFTRITSTIHIAGMYELLRDYYRYVSALCGKYIPFLNFNLRITIHKSYLDANNLHSFDYLYVLDTKQFPNLLKQKLLSCIAQ
jgi:hypothetical protein